jgi:hypothetical protein
LGDAKHCDFLRALGSAVLMGALGMLGLVTGCGLDGSIVAFETGAKTL